MIKKIISGGQTGADRAALDVAIKLDIPHGGWVPKGRKTDDGILPYIYKLKETPSGVYPNYSERNVINSDGTLIFARGRLIGGADYPRKMALKHRKQLLFVNLNDYEPFPASSLIASWIKMQKIEILNVAGPRASKDPEIYMDVRKILEHAIQILNDINRKPSISIDRDKSKKSAEPPKTVDEALIRLTSELSLKDKATIANMAEVELSTLYTNLGKYIRNQFGLWAGNKDLMISCCFLAKKAKITEDQAATIIIRELWKQLRESHRLRVVE